MSALSCQLAIPGNKSITLQKIPDVIKFAYYDFATK